MSTWTWLQGLVHLADVLQVNKHINRTPDVHVKVNTHMHEVGKHMILEEKSINIHKSLHVDVFMQEGRLNMFKEEVRSMCRRQRNSKPAIMWCVCVNL
jgi:hypothetical protein